MNETAPLWSLIIPTLNERDNILVLLRCLEDIAGSWPPCEVLVVDDRSEDGTATLVSTSTFSIPVRVLERDRVGGLAGAVLHGARAARASVVVVMDADLSHPPEVVAALAAPLLAGTHDLAIGSRHVAGGGCPDWPWRRRMMSRCAAWLATPFTHASDPMSGFFAARRADLLALGEEPTGFKILLELLARHNDPTRIAEIPIVFQDRRLGTSKLGLRTISDYLRRLVILGGCNLSPRAGAGFALVGLTGICVDLAMFSVCRQAGAGLAVAHMAGFATATVTNFLLNARYAFAARPGLSAYVRFVIVALLALVLRGGILSGAQAAGVPELLSVILGIAAGAVVNLIGIGFWVFPGSGSNRAGRWRLAAIGLVAYLVVLRLAYAGQTELIAEEAYYWNYAQHLDWGYFDHPPMVGWLIAASTWLLGDNPFAVRLPALGCWLVALVALVRLAQVQWGRDAGWATALVFAAMPFAIGAGLVMTPDAPLMAAWAVTLLATREALSRGRTGWWLVAGCALGLGMLSKYSIALLVPPAMLMLFLTADGRRQLVRPGPWLAVTIMALCFVPVIYWNSQHDWVSFRFQTAGRWTGAAAFHGHELIRDMLALAGPLVLAVALLGHRRIIGLVSRPGSRYLLLALGLPLAVFAAHACLHEPRPNWTGPPLLALVPLVGALAAWTLRCRPYVIHDRVFATALLLPVVLLGVFLHYVAIGLPGVAYPRQIARFIGWRQLGVKVYAMAEQERRDGGALPIIAGVDRYNIASQIAFATADKYQNHAEIASGGLFGVDDLMYRYWSPPAAARDHDVLVVGRSAKELSMAAVVERFTRMDPVQELPITCPDGSPLTTYFVRLGRGYHNPSP